MFHRHCDRCHAIIPPLDKGRPMFKNRVRVESDHVDLCDDCIVALRRWLAEVLGRGE